MRKVIDAVWIILFCAATGVFALVLLIIFWLFGMPSVVPPLSPALALWRGVPGDAQFIYDVYNGKLTWRYCRNLPSGRATLGSRGVVLEHGRRCGRKLSFRYEPATSLELPGLRVSAGGQVSFAVPGRPDFVALQSCPYTLSTAYLHRASALLSEARRLPDTKEWHRQSLDEAAVNVASFSADRLRRGDQSPGAYWCKLAPLPHTRRP